MRMEAKNSQVKASPVDAQFRVVTEHEAAARLSLGRRTLQDLRLTGEGPPYVKLGARRVGYCISDLQIWAESRRVTSTADQKARA